MTTLREAAQQALEALNVYASKAEHRRTHADDCAAEDAITALRAALAQQDEPVGTRALIEECLAAFAEELAA